MSKMMKSNVALLSVACWFSIGLGATIYAGTLKIVGSPEYDANTGNGFMKGSGDDGERFVSARGVTNQGVGVGYVGKYVDGVYAGYRVVRWDASGAATELGNLGTTGDGYTDAIVLGCNDDGLAVGYVQKWADDTLLGTRPVQWDPMGTAAVELDNLGTDSSGFANGMAWAVNGAGTVVGNVATPNNMYYAVRWDVSGAITSLDPLGEGILPNHTYASAQVVNEAGVAAGRSIKYVDGVYMGYHGVRWDASGTAATELENDAQPRAINEAGTIVGYIGLSNYRTLRAARWDAASNTATLLDSLGIDYNGQTKAEALAVNHTGTAVGYARKYVGGYDKGSRAVRWDASGTSVTELDNLGLLSTNGSAGSTSACAYAVNDAGTAVGYAHWLGLPDSKYARAVIWLPDASVINLNDLGLSPMGAEGTWTLSYARTLSADGWVGGEGKFDPDGDGPLAAYDRLWMAQVGLGGTWTNTAGGTWGRGPNWSTGTPAMQIGDARFDLNATYTVTLDRDEQTRTMIVEAGSVTIDFAGHTLATEEGLNIADGATLMGSGMLQSDVVNTGTIAPGNSPGMLDIDGDLESIGELQFEIADMTTYDEINVTGLFTASGVIVVSLLDDYRPKAGDQFDLMDFGEFADDGYVFDFTDAELAAGLEWNTSAFAANGSINVVSVPEPGTLTLLGMAVLGLLPRLWWRRNRCWA